MKQLQEIEKEAGVRMSGCARMIARMNEHVCERVSMWFEFQRMNGFNIVMLWKPKRGQTDYIMAKDMVPTE